MAITSLPEDFVVSTYVELVPAPLDPGMLPHSNFARTTTVVTDADGNYVASSGDRTDAVNQAIAVLQAREQ